MSSGIQAAVAVVGFFGLALVLAALLRRVGTAAAYLVVCALLVLALVLEATVDADLFAAAAFGLAIALFVVRFAFEAALWVADRDARAGRRR